jgi:hypothetical protein
MNVFHLDYFLSVGSGVFLKSNTEIKSNIRYMRDEDKCRRGATNRIFSNATPAL